MKYVGFWRRFAAVMLDGFVLMPFAFLPYWLGTGSKTLTIVLYVLFAPVGFLYFIFFHYKWGQTLGKMVCRIRMLTLEFQKITLKQAVLRSSVEAVFAIVVLTTTAIGYCGIPESDFIALGTLELGKVLLTYTMAKFLFWSQTAWVWSEFIVIFFNPKRRALQDFIAGTVLVVVPKGLTHSNPETVANPS